MTITDHSNDWLDEFDDAVFLYPEVAKPEYQHVFFTLNDRARWQFCELLSVGALPDEALNQTAIGRF